MFGRRSVILGALAAGIAGCTRTAAPPDVTRTLQGGGHVIYFRHGATTWQGRDSQHWPREEQRLLSETGIAQSRLIGARFREMGIPVGDVRASPFFRCTEMAELAFGRVTPDDRLLSPTNPSGRGRGQLAALRQLLSTPSEASGNLVLIAHSTNMQLLAGINLKEGEAAVFRPQGEGDFSFLGQVLPEDW